MIAIIPARGGSKGLPGKNIKLLCKKPLIAHTVEAARRAKGIDRVIVTTDDAEIAEAAKAAGAEIPFIRPEKLASDTAKAVDVYIHAVEYLMESAGEKIEKFMVLLPTAPLRTEKHIDEAIRLFVQEEADTLISVQEAETPVAWYFEKDSNGRMKNAGFGQGNAVDNRQVNNTYYIPNGAIYILDYKLLKEKRTYYSENTISYEMNRAESVDIDTELDFLFAEFLMKQRNQQEKIYERV